MDWNRLQELEERQAKRGDLTEEEEDEMEALQREVVPHEPDGIDPVTGKQRYRPLKTGDRI
jgi:hypothetical protein